jgi:hypothetical protein
MPSRIKIAGAVGAGATVALLFRFWVGWPGYVAIGVGTFFGVGFLIIAAALGEGFADADVAWRSRSVDLLGPPPQPGADLETPARASTPLQPVDRETDRSGEA